MYLYSKINTYNWLASYTSQMKAEAEINTHNASDEIMLLQ